MKQLSCFTRDLMPKVKVKYFGRLRELMDAKTEDYEVENGTTISNLLLEEIPERHNEASTAWKEEIFRKVKDEFALNQDGTPVLRNYLVLVKGKTIGLKYQIQDQDEIAILPPAGGG